MTATAGVVIHDEVFLVLTDAHHDKGYISKIVEANGAFYHFTAHGKRTAPKREHNGICTSLANAQYHHNRKVDEKRRKGYKLCDPGVIWAKEGVIPQVFSHLKLDKTVGVYAKTYEAPAVEVGSGQRHYDFDDEE
jgi:hypothetical protein